MSYLSGLVRPAKTGEMEDDDLTSMVLPNTGEKKRQRRKLEAVWMLERHTYWDKEGTVIPGNA